jgi:hypothetical protein
VPGALLAAFQGMTARTFALIVGIAFTVAGVLGFVPAFVTAPPANAPDVVSMSHGYLLGLFPVNALHNVVHLAIGLWGLAAWRGMTGPVAYARSLAVFYGGLAVLGLLPGANTLFGLVPIYGHDIWLHAGTALLAAWFGWRAPIGAAGHERRVAERRAEALRVGLERRRGRDRRAHGAIPLPG